MPLTLYISTKNGIRSALVRALDNNSPASTPEFTVGDTMPSVSVYLIDGNGGYDSASGSSSYTARLGIGNTGGIPTGGTFTITDGTATTSAIAFDASAATVQTALNAMNANTGPFGGTVTVTGSSPRWIVTWNAAAARAALTGSGAALTPSSGVSVSTLTDGSGSVAEVQMIRLARNPAIFQDTWSQTSDTYGWTASLSCNTREALDLLGTSTSLTTTLEFELTDGSGNRRTYCQVPCIIFNELIDQNAAVSVATGTSYLAISSALDAYVQNRTEITALTGGTSTKLDSIATVGKGPGWLARIKHSSSGAELLYRLESGTTAESAPWTIRPDDYNGSTNAKVWNLCDIKKDGAPCLWNATSSKFHQMIASESGGVVTDAIDQTGFQITS